MPVRRCAGCRQPDTVEGLVRLALTGAVIREPGVTGGDGRVLVLDTSRRLPGRGVNVHPRPRCLERALAPRALARALRVTSAPDSTAVRARLAEAGGSGW